MSFAKAFFMGHPHTITATYRVRADHGEIDTVARFIAFEQTVELPERLVTDSYLLEHVVAKVASIEPETLAGHYQVKVAYNAELASNQLSQLVNLVYGNVSMYPGIRLLDLALPETVLKQHMGPRHGAEGLRRLLGVHGRPLLATAIKPRGMPIAKLAQLAHDFALGGGDLVKDDQNLVSESFEAFKQRVDACATAVETANQKTGRRCLYLPHLSAPHQELVRYAEFVRQRDLAGVLMCPMILGMDTARDLANTYDLVYMAHPALSGCFTNSERQGISHAALLGTLLRLGGADVSIFPSPGGRFAYTAEQCESITKKLTEPLGTIAPALPAPAGGLRFEHIQDLCKRYGPDAVFLIGGSLQAHGDDLAQNTHAFMDAIRANSQEKLQAPQSLNSACEIRWDDAPKQAIREHLPFLSNWAWQGRNDQSYKDSRELEFKDVKRIELIGQQGEQTDFDLRYFEVEPGGYTSLEKHLHTHVIIAARGHGTLTINGHTLDLKPMDVAYVEPLKAHQIQCRANEPFGFFCIVDHERDKPTKP